MQFGYEDLVAAFGEPNVVRAEPADLERFQLSEETQRALTEIGLPRVIGDGAFQVIPPDSFEAAGRRYCRIGKSPNRYFAMDLDSEEVVSLAGWDPNANPSFLNSSVAAFVQCIAHYGIVQKELTTDRAPDVSAMWARRLRERLVAIDPRCLTEKNAYFASVVDDMEFGIL